MKEKTTRKDVMSHYCSNGPRFPWRFSVFIRSLYPKSLCLSKVHLFRFRSFIVTYIRYETPLFSNVFSFNLFLTQVCPLPLPSRTVPPSGTPCLHSGLYPLSLTTLLSWSFWFGSLKCFQRSNILDDVYIYVGYIVCVVYMYQCALSCLLCLRT